MYRKVILFVLVLSAAPQAQFAADTVHLSRYVLPLSGGSGGALAAVDEEVLIRFCQDPDGCKVSLKLSDGIKLRAQTTVLYVDDPAWLVWCSEAGAAPVMHNDNNPPAEPVLLLNSGDSFCEFGDFDASPTEDAAIRFFLSGAAPEDLTAVCTLVIED